MVDQNHQIDSAETKTGTGAPAPVRGRCREQLLVKVACCGDVKFSNLTSTPRVFPRRHYIVDVRSRIVDPPLLHAKVKHAQVELTSGEINRLAPTAARLSNGLD